MSIQILDKNVIDQIAAGEVVERPAHLVKELIENSLDAGATAIEVYFENSGRNVEIIDNGIGIPGSDLKLALERHATSKILKFDDIWGLSSYGFRGEALASISAVSDFEIVSRVSDSEMAYCLRSHFGKRQPLMETSNPQGTHLRISNLFENVPVRLKFLKSSSYEQGLIKQVIKAMALSQPGVEFKVYENRKLIYFYPKVTSLSERAQSILDSKENFFFEMKEGGFRIQCVFSSPYQVEKNTKNIWLFVQNRWVQDKVMVAAILESYQNLLMHGEYPQVVLKMEVPPEQVDVNIHPTKSQIKFLNSQLIYRMIYRSLRHEIEKAPWKKVEANPSNDFVGEVKPAVSSARLDQKSNQSFYKNFDQNKLPQFEFERKQYQQKEFSFQQPEVAFQKNSPWVQAEKFENQLTSVFSWASLHVVGQINLTYIICQDEQKMVLVDQHAAHERVLFEKLKAQYQANNIEIQYLLIPLSLDLESDQIEVLNQHNKDLQKLGVHFELLGPGTIGIVALPALLKEGSAVELVRKFVEEVKDLGGSFVFEKKLNDLIASMSCHSAIRAGQALSRDEMQKLLIQMDEYPLSSFCPHGRPVNVEFPFKQIERDFGRIV